MTTRQVTSAFQTFYPRTQITIFAHRLADLYRLGINQARADPF